MAEEKIRVATMGFRGGAFIASPLSAWLMSRFSSALAGLVLKIDVRQRLNSRLR